MGVAKNRRQAFPNTAGHGCFWPILDVHVLGTNQINWDQLVVAIILSDRKKIFKKWFWLGMGEVKVAGGNTDDLLNY